MRIAIYAFDGISMFHLAAPQLVFGEVNRTAAEPGWTLTLWTIGKTSVTLAEGYKISGLDTLWVCRRLGLLDFDQVLAAPLGIVERGFELRGWGVAEVAV